MRLNVYYDFCCDPEHVERACQYCHVVVGGRIYNWIKAEYGRDIEVVPINYSGNTSVSSNKYSHFYTIIENPDNNKYILISYWDKLYNSVIVNGDGTWDYHNCVDVLAACGVHEDDFTYKPGDFEYFGTSMMSYYVECEHRIRDVYNKGKDRVFPDKMFFRGGYHLFRKYVADYDDRFHIDYINRISPSNFIDEINGNYVNIDINCVAEITCRTPEIMGVGSALIRPRLGISYYNRLIPDYHYCEVKCSNLADYKELADAYYDAFNRLKNDFDYVMFLSENGRKYYLDNCTMDAHEAILKSRIDIKKLM